ncbi:hypothetical protein DTO217A2_4027 [Paecilomyces variotii]|nr:hypothetical protein DTO217A2_4027 [Paecilomyces variotii]
MCGKGAIDRQLAKLGISLLYTGLSTTGSAQTLVRNVSRSLRGLGNSTPFRDATAATEKSPALIEAAK